MNADRELLELAAKAAGISGRFETGGISRYGRDADGHNEYLGHWSPLTDDGDAFRLAVKLEIPVSPYTGYVVAADQHADYEGRDPCSVVRRTIVRAAAEIGKARHG